MSALREAIADFLYRHSIRYRMRRIRKRFAAEYKRAPRPFRVLFLISESSKWKYQSLYDAMIKDPMFDPFVVSTVREQFFQKISAREQ